MVALLVLALSFAMAPKKANAIPAFAQKYHFSCAVCHTVFPNLNPFGRAFWRNGFRLPGTNGTPADATQITEGLSLPNPWPVPVMVEPSIGYQHYTNENVNPQTDGFSAGIDLVYGGAFKLYTPLANSMSFYVHYAGGTLSQHQVVASLNGLGAGFGLPSHLLNLKLGQVKTATYYFGRQEQFYLGDGPFAGSDQGLAVGFDGEAGNLIGAKNPGFELYGTPGFHLWYRVSVTNDQGSSYSAIFPSTNYPTPSEALPGGTTSNAMEYSYQLKEYAPTPMGQLELGYYGATVAEPIAYNGMSWNNRVMVNGVDIDLANDIYELGVTYLIQSDSNPYGPGNYNLSSLGIDHKSNGYSTFDVYGRYLLPQIGNGLMLSADYATYSWTHKNDQETFNSLYGGVSTSCANANLYQASSYTAGGGNPTYCNDGIKDAVILQAEYNLAYNAHLYFTYEFTNNDQYNTLGTGLDFAF
ncbi:MAG: hypothetical protein ACYCTD_06385 [bacterium]